MLSTAHSAMEPQLFCLIALQHIRTQVTYIHEIVHSVYPSKRSRAQECYFVTILTVFVQLFSMLEGDVCAAYFWLAIQR